MEPCWLVINLQLDTIGTDKFLNTLFHWFEKGLTVCLGSRDASIWATLFLYHFFQIKFLTGILLLSLHDITFYFDPLEPVNFAVFQGEEGSRLNKLKNALPYSAIQLASILEMVGHVYVSPPSDIGIYSNAILPLLDASKNVRSNVTSQNPKTFFRMEIVSISSRTSWKKC